MEFRFTSRNDFFSNRVTLQGDGNRVVGICLSPKEHTLLFNTFPSLAKDKYYKVYNFMDTSLKNSAVASLIETNTNLCGITDMMKIHPSCFYYLHLSFVKENTFVAVRSATGEGEVGVLWTTSLLFLFTLYFQVKAEYFMLPFK